MSSTSTSTSTASTSKAASSKAASSKAASSKAAASDLKLVRPDAATRWAQWQRRTLVAVLTLLSLTSLGFLGWSQDAVRLGIHPLSAFLLGHLAGLALLIIGLLRTRNVPATARFLTGMLVVLAALLTGSTGSSTLFVASLALPMLAWVLHDLRAATQKLLLLVGGTAATYGLLYPLTEPVFLLATAFGSVHTLNMGVLMAAVALMTVGLCWQERAVLPYVLRQRFAALGDMLKGKRRQSDLRLVKSARQDELVPGGVEPKNMMQRPARPRTTPVPQPNSALKPLHVGNAVTDITQALRPILSKRNLEFYLDILEPEAWARLNLDYLHQALSQLIKNAIRFTVHGSVTVELTADPQRVMLRVTDTGVGIDPHTMRYVFSEHGENPGGALRQRKQDLARVRMLVALMDGRLLVESTGRGSTFTMAFARIPAPEGTSPTPSAPAAPQLEPGTHFSAAA